MIAKELKNHPVAYVVLLLFTIVFIVGFFIAWPNQLIEQLLIIGFAIFYVIWGIITHRANGVTSPELVKEYAMVAILGALLLLLLTF